MMKMLCLVAVVAGCYDNPPPRAPRIEAPAVVPGASLEIDSRVTQENRRVAEHERVCVNGSCDTVSVTHHQMVDVHHASATYNGQPLTYGQTLMLADPTFVQDQKRMAELTASCERAAIPRELGEALFLVGDIGIIEGGATSDGSIKEPWFAAGIAAVAAGITSYALGKYVFGGQDCAEASELYLKRSGQFGSADEKDVEDSTADEVETIAKDFNARMHATAHE
jgi:hypothetical protein